MCTLEQSSSFQGQSYAISTGFVRIKLQCFFCSSMKQLSTRHVLNFEAGYMLLSWKSWRLSQWQNKSILMWFLKDWMWMPTNLWLAKHIFLAKTWMAREHDKVASPHQEQRQMGATQTKKDQYWFGRASHPPKTLTFWRRPSSLQSETDWKPNTN